MRHLTGFAPLADDFDGFLIDLWGVIHDGVAVYPGAIECLERLQGKPVLLLSNAPRRIEPARQALRTLGVPDGLYTAIVTSGEAAWQALRGRTDAAVEALGDRVYHLGPARDRSMVEGLAIELVDDPCRATFLLNTGPDDTKASAPLSDFIAELDTCLQAALPMVCPNPDLEIIRGGARILCAGALAEYYASAGGTVLWFGKPYPAVYDLAVATLGIPRPRLLAVGDSIRTDLAGAAGADLQAAWVLGGIHSALLTGDRLNAEMLAARAGVSPMATLPSFVW